MTTDNKDATKYPPLNFQYPLVRGFKISASFSDDGKLSKIQLRDPKVHIDTSTDYWRVLFQVCQFLIVGMTHEQVKERILEPHQRLPLVLEYPFVMVLTDDETTDAPDPIN